MQLVSRLTVCGVCNKLIGLCSVQTITSESIWNKPNTFSIMSLIRLVWWHVCVMPAITLKEERGLWFQANSGKSK
jgi:hypothetical protein